MEAFELIMSPFVFIIKHLFLGAFALTGSYGLAILLLSFAISVLLLPIFIFIEKAKKKDDVVKQRMKPVLEEIKRSYKGQERYYYIRTLQRQHNYSSFRALIPILSLLLQIPFFIAAYQFLENFEPLSGVGFLFIKDLSIPDALLGGIHFLPILMTLVNLLTAYFYTRHGNASERKQMAAVAGVFLILLYNFPSSLVLYWTMNNVFSFFRLFVTNPEAFKEVERKKTIVIDFAVIKSRYLQMQSKLWVMFHVLFVLALLSQLNWAFMNNFNDLALRIYVSLFGALLSTVAVGILSVSLNVENYKSTKNINEFIHQFWGYFKYIAIILVFLAVVSQVNWAVQNSFYGFWLRSILAITIGIFVTILLGLVILYNRDIVTINKQWTEAVKLKGKFRTAFYFVLIAALFSQINWALHFDFKSIIPRLVVVSFISWFVVFIVSRMSIYYKRAASTVLQNTKTLYINRLKKNVLMLIVFSVLIFLYQQIFSTQSDSVNIVLRALVSVSLGTLGYAAIIFIGIAAKTICFNGISVSPKLYFSLFFLGIYFYLASNYYYGGENPILTVFSVCIIAFLQIVGLLYLSKSKTRFRRLFYWLTLALAFLILLWQIIFLHSLFSVQINAMFENSFLAVTSKSWLGVSLIGLIFTLFTLPHYFSVHKIILPQLPRFHWFIYLFSVLYLSGFIFLWNPIDVYSTYPSVFGFPAIEILAHNITLFSIICGIMILLYLLMPGRVKVIWLIVTMTLVFVGFVNNTINPLDLGVLQEYKYVNQSNLAQPVLQYIIEGLLILTFIFSILYILNKNVSSRLLLGILLLNIVTIGQSITNAINTGTFLKVKKISVDIPSSISFSNDKQNVVFLIVDMFHGWYMEKIIKEQPHLKNAFDGFVWYPNTLSVSILTAASIGPILGGGEYTADRLNKDNSKTLEEKVTSITENFLGKVKSNGYKFTGTKMIYSKIDNSKFDTYLPLWHESWNLWNHELNIGMPKESGFDLLWANAAFYSAPLFLKPQIYNNGRWLHGEIRTNENTTAAQPYNFLRLLPHISSNNGQDQSFIYIHSMASHHPWDIVDKQGVMHTDVSPYENNKWTIETLATWIEWMQENEVYDNTKIIILSDHGPHWNHYKGGIDNEMPITYNPNLKADKNVSVGLYPLLLVKDFRKSGPLTTDMRFMSNSDAIDIIFERENPTVGEPKRNRKLTTTLVQWENKLWENTALKINQMFEVTDSAYNLYYWRILDTK
jgi:YidC/Oxa1 family membrane protein insertase